MLGNQKHNEYFIVGISGLAVFCTAVTYTWSSPLLNSFRSTDSPLYLTSIEIALLTSACDISSFVFSVPAGYAADAFGRKTLIWLTTPVLSFSWFFLFAFENKAVLFAIRFVQGIMLGILNSVLGNYMAETVSPKIRGNVIALSNVAWHIGTLYIYIVGTFFGLVGLTWFTLIPNIIFGVLFFWFPETPYYLVMKGKKDEASQVLIWIRGGSTTDGHIVTEIQSITETVQHDKSVSIGAWRNLFSTRKGLKGLFIVELVTIVYSMGGTNTIPVYAADTFAQLSGNDNLANVITIGLGVLLVLTVLPSAFLTDKWGRRPLLLLSMGGSVIFFIPTSILLYLIQKENMTGLPVQAACYVFLIIALSFTTLGVESVQPVVQTEFFPSTSRSIAAGGTYAFTTLLQSLSCYMYELIDDEIGIYFNYIVFLIVTVIGMIGVYTLMPETKGKSFAEIQNSL